MNTKGKLLISILCLAVAGCGLVNPYEKWENEGQHPKDRLLPSGLKAALCSQDWWKADYGGKTFYFHFEEEGMVTSSSTMKVAAVKTKWHLNWTSDKEVIILFDDETHLTMLEDEYKEQTLVVSAFDRDRITAKGLQTSNEIILVPADEQEYEQMEEYKLNYILAVEHRKYLVGQEGGELRVKIIGGDWNVVIPEQDWLRFERRDGEYAVFSYTRSPHRFRVQQIEVRQTDPDGNQLTCSFIVTGVNIALDLTNRYATTDFKGSETVKQINELTYEALICPTDFPNTINTVMGVEGQFLLRLGDAGYPKDQLQVAYAGGGKISPGEAAAIAKNAWTHIAVTMSASEGKMCVYINGLNVFTESKNVNADISDFKIGRSANYTTRFFTGYMAEIRVWTKALTGEEINAENHFYSVDPASEGLFAYWRCDDAAGNILKDATRNGYDCTGDWTDNSAWDTTPLAFPLPK